MPVPLRGVFAETGYWLLRYRRTWRATVVISVANPVLFLTATGIGLGQLVDRNHSHYLNGTSYLAFLAPGLLAAAVMQTAYIEAAGPVAMSARPNGAYHAAISTPLQPRQLYLGHLIYMAFRIATSALAFAVVACLFGAVPATRLLVLAGAAVLTGLAFAAPVAAWAVTIDRPTSLNAGFRFVIMPMYMFAGTFFVPAELPTALRDIVACTPLYQGAQLCRQASLGFVDTGATLVHVGYLVAAVAIGIALGSMTYRRRLTA
jgi:lipooligosaccharide transport system permease protein